MLSVCPSKTGLCPLPKAFTPASQTGSGLGPRLQRWLAPWAGTAHLRTQTWGLLPKAKIPPGPFTRVTISNSTHESGYSLATLCTCPIKMEPGWKEHGHCGGPGHGPGHCPGGGHPPGGHPPGVHPPGVHPPGVHPPGVHPPGVHPPGSHPPGRHPPGTCGPPPGPHH
ncbi:proline, histidine and glycine-rich protein 1 isoform X1 [Pteropus medius]|uniref:proline, histidine and glycine-rich protein 1 isoform X1 n=1 Tax=Pteropus vampyrus TaxID=132908 RepID=UPI00196A21F6|nr:proline, histidine and glycine-rich protein 1 isoform X1 [Pteropus giganteus]